MNASQHPVDGFEERLLSELRRVVVERAGDAPVADETAAVAHPPFIRKRSLALAGGLAAAIGVVLATGVIGGGDGDKAYAVTENGDGTVTVEIASLSDAAGLERKLDEAGIPALVQYVPPGKTCARGTGFPKPPPPPAGTGALESGIDRRGLDEAGAPSTHVEGTPGAGTVTRSARAPGGEAPEGAAVSGGMRVNEDGSVEFTVDAPNLDGQTLLIRNHDYPAGQAPDPGPGTPAPAGASSVGIAFVKGEATPCKVVDAG